MGVAVKPVRIPRDVQWMRTRWGVDPLVPGWWTNGDVIAFVGEKAPRRPHRDHIEDLLILAGPGYIARELNRLSALSLSAVVEDASKRTAFVRCPVCHRRRWGGHCPACIGGEYPGVLRFGFAQLVNNDCTTTLDVRYADLLVGLSTVRYGVLPTDPIGGLDADGDVAVIVMPIAPGSLAQEPAA